MNKKTQKHWNKVYSSNEISELGWYEEIPYGLNLVDECNLDKDSNVLDVGVGATTLIDYLLERGFKNISAVDISDVAINKLKERLGEEKATRIEWLIDDLTQPEQIHELENIALWHDRAVLHFLLKESDRQTYFSILKKIVKIGGFVIISAFSLEGAKKCTGLKVVNYDETMLQNYLGKDFKLLKSFHNTYTMPSGSPRPFIYTLFQRVN